MALVNMQEGWGTLPKGNQKAAARQMMGFRFGSFQYTKELAGIEEVHWSKIRKL